MESPIKSSARDKLGDRSATCRYGKVLKLERWVCIELMIAAPIVSMGAVFMPFSPLYRMCNVNPIYYKEEKMGNITKTVIGNGNMQTAIPRTDRFMELINTRLKYFLGSDACVGKDYSGWETVEGERYDGISRSLCYENEQLYVLERDAWCVVALRGDIADYQGRLISDGSGHRHDIRKLRGKVEAYMTEHDITEYSSDVGRHALWVPRYPRTLVEECVRVYEMTLDLEIRYYYVIFDQL